MDHPPTCSSVINFADDGKMPEKEISAVCGAWLGKGYFLVGNFLSDI